MDIIIFCGQSNMQGQTDRLSDNSIVKGAYEYKWLQNELTPLCNPVGENITYDKKAGVEFDQNCVGSVWRANHVLGSACYGYTNLVPKFCEAYIARTGNEVTAVHAAKGDTIIAQWLPGTPAYQMLKEKALGAIRKVQEKKIPGAGGNVQEHYRPGHIYFVWLQGESDAIKGHTREDYIEKLLLLQAALQKDLGIGKFGIIRVGHFTNDDRDLEIMAAQEEVCRENEAFVMLTQIATELNQEPEYMNPNAAGHFSAKGLERLGEAAGDMLGLVERTDDKG